VGLIVQTGSQIFIVDFYHAWGMFHHDLKLENLLIDDADGTYRSSSCVAPPPLWVRARHPLAASPHSDRPEPPFENKLGCQMPQFSW
jgi:hypothetical protein